MSSKCEKYESLFIFGSSEDLKEHLESCPDCRLEHEKMLEVASAVKEVKPFISRKTFYQLHISKIAACFIFLSVGFLGMSQYSNQMMQQENQKIVKENSVVTQMGLPTDDYGFLQTDN